MARNHGGNKNQRMTELVGPLVTTDALNFVYEIEKKQQGEKAKRYKCNRIDDFPKNKASEGLHATFLIGGKSVLNMSVR